MWENNLSGVEPYLLATAILQLEEVGSFTNAIIFTVILNVLLPARGGWFFDVCILRSGKPTIQ